MERRYLQCDICGSQWDITNTDLNERINPGLCYINNKVREGVRQFKLMSLKSIDDKISIVDLDLCDGCYNKLDRFIFDLANGEEN